MRRGARQGYYGFKLELEGSLGLCGTVMAKNDQTLERSAVATGVTCFRLHTANDLKTCFTQQDS
jgi:hypothetical protein